MFEQFKEDLDPYGEERWNDEPQHSLDEYFEVVRNIDGIIDLKLNEVGWAWPYISFKYRTSKGLNEFYVYDCKDEPEDDEDINGMFLMWVGRGEEADPCMAFNEFDHTYEVKLTECTEEYFMERLHYLVENEVINHARYRI